MKHANSTTGPCLRSMIFTRAVQGFVVALMVAMGTGASPWSVSPQSDGSAMVFVAASSKASAQSAFSLVVDVGAAQDPEGKEGMAFVTAHALLEGPANVVEPLTTLLGDNNAKLDVMVGMFATRFTLTAPDDKLATLIPAFVSRVTNPFWHTVDVEALVSALDQKVAKEHASAEAQLDQLLFPSVNRGRIPHGTKQGRASVSIEDVQEFFSKTYRSSAMTWIAASRQPAETITTLVNDAVALPPLLSARRSQESSKPNLPSEVTIKGQKRVVTIAKPWPATSSRSDCRGLAIAFEVAFAEKTKLSDQTRVRCRRWRGKDFMIFRAADEEGADSDLTRRMRSTMKTIRGQPVSRRNARAYSQRRKSLRAQILNEPAFAVGFIGDALEGDDRPVETILAEWGKTPTAAPRVKKSIRSILTSKKSAVIDVSPAMKRNRSRNQ